MTTVKEFNENPKAFGWVKATILSVTRRTPSGYIIDDLNLDDGTGQIVLSVFNPTLDFKIGQVINATKCYTKVFRNKIQLNQKKDGTISIVGTGSVLDAAIKDASNKINGATNQKQTTPAPAPSMAPANVTIDMSPVAAALDRIASAMEAQRINSEQFIEKMTNRFIELQAVILQQVREMLGVENEPQEDDEE
jgi:hypothetical protein